MSKVDKRISEDSCHLNLLTRQSSRGLGKKLTFRNILEAILVELNMEVDILLYNLLEEKRWSFIDWSEGFGRGCIDAQLKSHDYINIANLRIHLLGLIFLLKTM